MLQGQPLQPLKHALQIYTDTSKERWGSLENTLQEEPDPFQKASYTSTQQLIIIIIMYLYSAQYLHILQDSKRYLTNPAVQVQPQLTSN